ncbi:unnamed protein product [Owenia fusiformis]|uniref:Uncharacterized protein n=1 Tax=Owenia fusiformis TaxID=6347 RepID=A0A8J1TNA2_OWEFU|nr:unnamed protein product [Owenia fusiformis]
MSGHGHSCGQDHHKHDHDDAERGQQYSLYLKIDTEKVQCLNEVVDGSGKDVFKPWDRRLDSEKFVESDADEELLFNIPFTGNIKLKGIIVIGGEGDQHPAEMKLFKNRPHMTFDDAAAEADQVFEMHEDRLGQLEYETKISRFSSVEHLTIYFTKNFGDDITKVYYIGLKGEFSEFKKHGVTICTYEARAMPSDHKANAFDSVGHEIN